MSAIVRTPAVPESSGALPPVSPQDKYLNRIIGVIFVSTGDVGRDSIRGNAFTHDIRSGIFQNTSTCGALQRYIMHAYTMHTVHTYSNLRHSFHVLRQECMSL